MIHTTLVSRAGRTLTSRLLLGCTLALGGMACGSQSPSPVVAEPEPAEPVVETEATTPEPVAEFNFEVESRREFTDETLPPATDDSVWPPTDIAVAPPEGAVPLRAVVRPTRHTLEMSTSQNVEEVRAFYQAAFEAQGYTLSELDFMAPELTRFGASHEGEATGIEVTLANGGNDTLKLTYKGPRMPSIEAGGETATEDACRQALTAARTINLARVGIDTIPDNMRESLDASLAADVALCAGHWRAPHLECFTRYANEPAMLSQCNEVARRDAGQPPLPR
ncbi:MAG: hypothetical protein AB8H86_24470 [Polyangiales bacterium]